MATGAAARRCATALEQWCGRLIDGSSNGAAARPAEGVNEMREERMKGVPADRRQWQEEQYRLADALGVRSEKAADGTYTVIATFNDAAPPPNPGNP